MQKETKNSTLERYFSVVRNFVVGLALCNYLLVPRQLRLSCDAVKRWILYTQNTGQALFFKKVLLIN